VKAAEVPILLFSFWESSCSLFSRRTTKSSEGVSFPSFSFSYGGAVVSGKFPANLTDCNL